MEIEVGEFVRTEEGEILKYDENHEKIYIDNFKDDKNFLNIAKHSKQLIDLIETGDIVEYFVEEDVDGEDTIKYEVAGTEVTDLSGNKTNEIGICGESGVELIPFDNVRSILTHEQFEQNCYRLEE